MRVCMDVINRCMYMIIHTYMGAYMYLSILTVGLDCITHQLSPHIHKLYSVLVNLISRAISSSYCKQVPIFPPCISASEFGSGCRIHPSLVPEIQHLKIYKAL